MSQFLYEDMTFDQLFRYSEPKRIKRSQSVRGPPLEIHANSDNAYHVFNFKSFPSTTGLRHHGFVKFKKPEFGNPRKPLQHIPCEVDCTCPDYRYRFAWVNKQKHAGRVGANSMNQAWNKAPNRTNPSRIPGLCKHILAARDYIYGLMAKFPGGAPDTGEKMTQLVKYADRRWSDFDGLMAKAKDTEKWFKAMKSARNVGQGADMDYVYRLYIGMGGTNAGIPKDIEQKYVEKPAPPPVAPAAAPLPQRTARPRRGPVLPAAGEPRVGPPEGGEEPPQGPEARPPRLPRRPGGGPARESLNSLPGARVDNVTADELNASMTTTLKEAYRIIEEIEHDEVAAPSAIAADMADRDGLGGADLPPSEPPMDDSAIDADTQGNVAIELLSDIRDLVGQLVAAKVGEPEMGEEPGGEPEGAGEAAAVDALPEPEEEEEEDEEDDGMPPRPSHETD